MTDKKDIFYYARFYGIPIYYQPEEGEIIGRNWFYNKLVDIAIVILMFLFNVIGDFDYKITILHKTITRQAIKEKLGGL